MNQQNCEIIISEPWNFESIDGKNIIRGKIIDNLNDTCLVFKANYDVSFEDYLIGRNFILYSRSNHSFTDIGLKNRIQVNGGLLPLDYDYNEDFEYLISNSKFVFIGTLYK
ncbi:hypothetical protein [Dysgonomonas macrotermitis]|uniref:Uncharacterized protein n=1 Tax=Dysgonomonas macrotermitis TaxID=1346286 RepID=A0A1M4W7G5_9BACT|nr:hypothetical protein [Dysgonomonas macrotermitis]SHE77095.1 hypothetical protein SAMN05444362_102147 [Dysgonomonas macrotermitis]